MPNDSGCDWNIHDPGMVSVVLTVKRVAYFFPHDSFLVGDIFSENHGLEEDGNLSW